MKIQLWLIGAIFTSAFSAWSTVSQQQALEIADSYIRNVDGGFLAAQINKQTRLIKSAKVYAFDSQPPFYSVWFELVDKEQELIYQFNVLILKYNGIVIDPPDVDPYYGMHTYSKWLSEKDYCRFHPDDSICFWDTPI